MAQKPTSLVGEVRELRAELFGEARFVDVALALRRAKDQSTLLLAGGQWDRLDAVFTGRDPERCVLIDLEESQVGFTEWFATWLRDFREGYPRDVSLVLNAGDRRGGKTFNSLLCQIAALIDVPRLPNGAPTIGWAISKSYRQRDELDEIVSGRVPARLYHHQRAPEHTFTFAHGSRLRNLSADDPDSLKQGRVDFLLYNEGQLMSPRAIKNGLYGTSDQGGITILAANPPTGPEGDWLRDLKDAIDADPDTKKITRFFNFSSKQNTKIDAPARRRNAAIAKHIDPDMADADSDGTWRAWGDLACPGWDKRSMIHSLPSSFEDVTHIVTRRELHTGAPFVIGGDFQRRPQAAAVLKVYRENDKDIYHFVHDVGVKGTETELSTTLMGEPYALTPDLKDPRGALWIGDCSGSYQGAMRVRGQTSFGLLEADGWKVFPAETIKAANSERPKNPLVAQRLGLVYRLMRAGRVRVAPECSWLTESFAKCTLRRTSTGTRVPQGHLAHILDAASYALYRLEPKPKRAGSSNLPARGSFHAAPQAPRRY